MVSTNGHVLILAKDTAPFDDADFPQGPHTFTGTPTAPVPVPSAIVKRLIAATPKKTTIPVLQGVQVSKNGSDNSAVLTATDLQVPVSVTITPDGETFPAYDRVLPKPDRAVVSIRLGVPVLEVLLKSAKALDARSIVLSLPTDKEYHDKGTPGAVVSAITATTRSTDSGIEVLAVAMPMRE